MTEPVDREQIEEERAFLLRSLDDLDAEHADGNVDDATYERLRGDYVARAARATRLLDGQNVSDSPAAAPAQSSTVRRVVIGLSVAAFVVLASVALAFGLGVRLPGETITGTQRSSTASGPSLKQLRADVQAAPADPSARLDLARALMAKRDFTGAVTEFSRAAQLDPGNPEPFTYSGWLIRLQGFPDQGIQLLDKAIEVDGEYPDAHAFKGITLLRDKQDPEAAITEFRRYLVLAPDSPLADQVRTLLAQAVESGTSTTTSTTSTTR
ncbi:MAG: tetratricopeptide repeat protein [Acidimicrobiia bacterium]|nr:tetratricopeptide repeat protein [Acidimicrobiia bacterium]